MNRLVSVFVTNERRQNVADDMTRIYTSQQQRTQDTTSTTTPPGSFSDAPPGGTGSGNGGCDHCLAPCEIYRISGSTVIDPNSLQWGSVSGSYLWPDAATSAAITIQADCTRLTDTTFQLPTQADCVVDVWFDDLHADPGYQYSFDPRRTITTIATVPSGIVISAVYLNYAP